MNKSILDKAILKIFDAEEKNLVDADKMVEKLEKRISEKDIDLLIEDMLCRTEGDLLKESYRFLWENLIYNNKKKEVIIEKIKNLPKKEKEAFIGFAEKILSYLKDFQDDGSFDEVENSLNPYIIFKNFFEELQNT